MKSQSLFWPTIVALAVALTAVRSTGPTESPAADAEAPRGAASAARAEEKWFLGRPERLETRLEHIEKRLVATTGGEGEGRKPRYLVALVPDPAFVDLKYFFDRQIEAVQRAIETFGYVSLREEVGALNSSGAGGGSGDEPLGILAYVAKRDDPPLIVLLVGESPVAGPDPSVLAPTLAAVAARCRAAGSRDVAILGPTFSGSRRAIRVAMDRVIESPPRTPAESAEPTRFTVVSGSATAFANKTDLEGPYPRDPKLRFAATVHPDSALFAALYEFLGASRSKGDLKLAILSESNSGYGQSIQQATKGGGAANSETVPDLVSIPFPMHVSSLRQAREKGKNGRAGAVDLREVAADFRSSLRISLDDPGGRRHGLPVQDPNLSPVAIELMLDEIANTLVRERVTHAVIFATDVRDKLFLADEIRAHCPNARLVTFEADALLLHPDVATTLEGMIVVSTYPLNGWVSLHGRGGGPNRMVPFASNGSQGTFNAALCLLDLVRRGVADWDAPVVASDRGEWAFEVGGVPSRGPVFDRVEATAAKTEATIGPSFVAPPPIWISAVANGRFWPLDAIHVREIESALPASLEDVAAYTVGFQAPASLPAGASHPAPSRVPPAPFLILGATVAFACVLAGCRNAKLFLPLGVNEPAPMLRYRVIDLGATAVPFVYMAAVALPPEAEAIGTYGDRVEVFALRALLSLALSVVTIGFLFAFSRFARVIFTRFDPVEPLPVPPPAPWPPPWKGSIGAWAARFLPLLAVIALASLLLFFCPFERHILSPLTWADSEALLRERAFVLLSGVSPVWPLLFVFGGLWWWSFTAQWRFARIRFLGGGLAIEHAGTRWRNRIRHAREELLRSAWSFRFARLDGTALAVLPGIATFAAAAVVTFRSDSGATFESANYETTLLVGGGIFCLGAFMAGQHALQIARALRSLTGALSHHPVEDAFAKMPPEVAKGMGRQFWGRAPAEDDVKDWIQKVLDLCAAGVALKSEKPETRDAACVAARLRVTRRRLERDLDALEAADDVRRGSLIRRGMSFDGYRSAVRAAKRLDVVAERMSRSEDKAEREFSGRVRVVLALQILLWVRTVYALMRTLLALVSVTAVMGLLASVSYPFTFQSLYGLLAWGVIGSGIAAFAIVYVNVSRDATLSRIAGTTPGKATIDWSAVQATVLFVLVPLAALLAIQFPNAREWLSTISGLARTMR